MPRTKNELCAVLQVSGATTTSLGQALVTKRINEVGVVRNVIFTSKKHADMNGQFLSEYLGTLFCRRKYIEEKDMRKKQIVSFQIQ